MKKIKVNISTPSNWDFDTFLRLHSPGGSRAWEEFQFYHNHTEGSFDCWVVLNELSGETRLWVPAGNTFLVTTEEADVIIRYNQWFVNQFDHIVTSRTDIQHQSVIHSHYFTIWHIKRSYDQLKYSLQSGIRKSKNLSAIISGRLQYGRQADRYVLISRLKSHFKDNLDWFSREQNPITDKWEGLAPYRYSIAIENSAHPNYFTEKIVDVVLSDAVPFYWGDPNIFDFFSDDVVISIPIDDYEQCVDIIESTVKSERYSDYLPLLRQSKMRILDEYQFLPWISKILREKRNIGNSKTTVRLRPMSWVSFRQRLARKMGYFVGWQ